MGRMQAACLARPALAAHKPIHMKLFTALLLALTVVLTGSCSRNGPEAAGGSKSQNLPASQVADIVTAVDASDVEKAKMLLQANPKLIGAVSDQGWPLLLIASQHGSRPMVELLLSSGADVNARNYSNEVALDYAALHGHKEIVQVLLDHHADVNIKNDAGATPLSAATSAGQSDIAALLKQHGAKE
jgi:ankyrin repeat protein